MAMTEIVCFAQKNEHVEIAFDDGRLNIMSPTMLRELHKAFDRAERERQVVVLKGREGIFSAGFDLKVFREQGPEAICEMLLLGAELARRVLAFPVPVLSVCTGHAYPMGAFLLLASDVRLGVQGPFRIGLNEVAIGITIPSFGIELARHRLTPSAFQRTAVTGEMFSPDEAVLAGFLDRAVEPATLDEAVEQKALALAKLDFASHAATKQRVRCGIIATVREAIDAEIQVETYRRRFEAARQP
jgi:enoyl-CoA hydratase